MIEDLFSASQQETLPSKLDIVYIQYLRQSELDWKELFSGFETLRAITYSSSLKFLNEVIDLFQDVEIIFGNELILGTSLQEIIAYQDTAIERVRDYTRKEGYRLLERIDNGTLRLYIAHEQLSHEKLFILERSSGKPRTILGSANFSFAAFSGRQRELISVEETEEGYHCYLKAFEELKRLSSDRITREQIKVANCGPGIDKIPVLESVVETGSLVLIADTNREDIRFVQEVHERAKRIRPLFPEASRNSPLRFKPKDV
ncbi:MAG: NgoFVII family restriction endonuclease [Calothrix sp. SM1_5_4]|nr:NgoFVII family restriction endonuclease [Calothrix sp. SM1_5_4]